ncbi:MAG TPA: ATP-binding protein, partial [Acidimicrobiales bacterium]|nr:ATP-binding protein [Acidimicrobiales bacterium]
MAPVLCPVLVGRQQEFERLCEALVDARRGRGVCAVLVGEPGIGKSRLARELIAGAEERGMTVLTGRAVPGAGTAAYRPVAEVALQASRRCGLPSDPAFAPFRRALTGIVPGVEAEGPASEPSPAVRGEAVVRLITACAPDGALVVLEDLHWADPDTVALVEYLTDNLTREPILVVLTVRDEPVSPALDLVRRQRGRPGIVQFDLARLSADEVADMVRACDEDAPADVVARVQHAAEGVPLLAEELLAAPGL